MDPRIKKLAEVLTHYSLELKKGQLIKIQGETATMPLIKAVYKEAIDVGAYPFIQIIVPDADEHLLRNGTDAQLKYLTPMVKLEVRKMDAFLNIWGGENTCYLSGVDPKRQALRRKSRKSISELFMRRAAKGELRWCGTQFPTLSDAQEARMSLSEYEDFVYGAGHILKGDTVKHWKKVHSEQQRLIKILNRVDRLHFISNDADLKMSVKGRTWINCSGRENFPDGEVFTGPIENSAEGKIRFSYPAVYAGNEVEDVTLEFKRGKVVNFTAAKNEKFLKGMLEMDKGAKFIGEIAIGTNYDIKRYSKNILFDEKIGGTCHLALGAGYPESGSKNKSGLHWDMVCDLKQGGEIIADGKTIYRNGKFLI